MTQESLYVLIREAEEEVVDKLQGRPSEQREDPLASLFAHPKTIGPIEDPWGPLKAWVKKWSARWRKSPRPDSDRSATSTDFRSRTARLAVT